MTDFNPLAGAILGSAQAQHVASTSKERQIRRSQTLRKNVAATDDEVNHQVESADAIEPVGDEEQSHADPRKPRPRKGKGPADDRPHLDIRG